MTDNNTALKKAGLKVTLPRLKILEVLQEPDNHHVSAEDLYKRLIDMGEEIGLATVYRVLNQFDDAGIVTRHNFEGGKSVFELTQQHHHDHLICLDCGKVIEFSDDSIELRAAISPTGCCSSSACCRLPWRHFSFWYSGTF